MSAHGTFSFRCCHTDHDPFGGGGHRYPSCGAPATRKAYGMDRCEDHAADLDPATWPANQPGYRGDST